MAAPPVQAVRRWILTGAVTAITVTGTIYGAGLKSESDVKKERKRYQQATPEEIITQLEIAREDLVLKKKEMERKIVGFHEKKKLRAIEEERQREERRKWEEHMKENAGKKIGFAMPKRSDR